jgi:hypothetical protein
MRGLILSLALFPAVLLLGGCTSLKGKAKDFLDAGAYEQALDYYQRAVDKDPADAEARSGLNLARTKYIDKKLIETRMARLGGNSQNAMDLLLDVVQKEKTWQFAPAGQVSGTQEEETAEGLRFLEAKSQQAISSDRPLLGLYFYKHYQPVFESSIISEAQRKESTLLLSVCSASLRGVGTRAKRSGRDQYRDCQNSI